MTKTELYSIIEKHTNNFYCWNEIVKAVDDYLLSQKKQNEVVKMPLPADADKRIMAAFVTAQLQDEQWRDEDTIRLAIKNLNDDSFKWPNDMKLP